MDSPFHSPESYNLQFLLGDYHLTPKERQMYETWYRRVVRFSLMPAGEEACILRENPEQRGGGDYLYTTTHEGQEYHVKIRDLILSDEYNQNHEEIYIMSPLNGNVTRRCVFAKILKEDPHTAILDDLILAHNCTDLSKTPPKLGWVYVNMMTHFLVTNHERLGIKRIELTDNAHYHCPNNRHLSIHLEKSRQLEGDDPYYVQFGYRPKYSSTVRRLEKNKRIMSQIMTKDDKDLGDLCRIHKCDVDVIRYIQSHQDQPLSKTLRYISRKTCVVYDSIYGQFFKNCGLRELVSPIYVMDL